MIILEGNGLTRIYGGENGIGETKAIRGVNISIEKGEFIAIMGPSGSGKTTLLNILSGIDVPTGGKVKINEKNIGEMDKETLAAFRRKEIGFVFQDFNLLDTLTVKENILLPMVLDNKSSEEMDRKSEELMKTLDIFDISNKYPYSISGGQQQRTAVARALVNNPSIVFGDEPTGNLDSKSSKNIMECFKKLNEELMTTTLIVTHDVFAASYCNKVIFIKDGKFHSEVVKKGSRREFLNIIMNSLSFIGGEGYDI